MKKIILLLSIFSLLSCKNEKTEQTEPEDDLEISKAREIADAHGFENFKDVKEIKFTFNVKVNDSVRTSRSWHWKTKNNEIRLTEGDISFTYVQDENIAEDEKEIDQKFINDSYWLLFPFQLVWSDPDITEEKSAEAPISKKEMNSILASYSSEGGYTPGDSYEIFYEDDLIIREWIYRSADGSRESPTTWEDYGEFNGLKIAKSHKSPDGSFDLFFSDIEVN